jgi:hypothetical protein
MKLSTTTIGLVGLCCATACSLSPVNDGFVASQLVSASNGGTVSVAAGKDAALIGTAIQVPPASLAKDTTITIKAGNALPLSSDFVSAGPVAQFGPDGLAFANPATITIPYQLPSGASESSLTVFGVESDGTVLVVDNGDLTIDSTHHTVAFAAAGFTSFGAASGTSATAICPPGSVFCGCCGSGKCLPQGVACPLVCPEIACRHGGGGTCCPAGEYFCGCGGQGNCIPDNEVCPLACPAQASGAATPAPNPTCCPAGEYFCGCLGQGKCIPDNEACPAICPVCGPTSANGQACPPNEVCLNGKCVPVFVADGGTHVCDPTTPCAASETCCGCCGKGICLPAGQACPIACPNDLCPPPNCDSASPVNQCPNGGVCCPGCCGQPGYCLPPGGVCPALPCPSCPPPTCGIAQNGQTTTCAAGEICCPGCCGAPGVCVTGNVCPAVTCPVCPPPTCGTTANGQTNACPAGDTCCPGCCGAPGFCVPGNVCPGVACPACPPPSDAGVTVTCGPTSTGQTNACPAGDTCCPGCCGGEGICVPSGQACPLLECPICDPLKDAGVSQTCDPSSAAGSTGSCPKGESCCGCNGVGQCIPDGEACPALCPAP